MEWTGEVEWFDGENHGVQWTGEGEVELTGEVEWFVGENHGRSGLKS